MVAVAASLDIDPYEESRLREPYATYQLLRDSGPIVWLAAHNCYAVARHAITQRVLQDYPSFSSAGGVGLANIKRPDAWRAPSPLVEADPPAHTVLRKAMERILSPTVIRGWRDGFAAEAQRRCDEVLASGEFDGVGDLAFAYVQQVFPTAMGIAPHPANFRIVGHHNARFEASQRVLETIMDWYLWSQTPDALMAGGFGSQVFAAERDGVIPEGTAGPIMRTLVRGGLDTTISGISSTLLYLARNPDQWALVKSDPTNILPAFEEALRLESPTPYVFRTTTAIAEIDGLRLEPDQKVLMCIGAANRDPAAFADADAYLVRRAARHALMFGSGAHHCLGQRTARLEAECLLGELFSRVDRLELTGEPEWETVNALRSLKHLPLRVHLH
jgi:4-methoxybenzoate monooxygenase (O-demethylating)